MQPLQRVEKAIGDLSTELEDIHRLPEISEKLTEINSGIGAIVELLGEIRDELAASRANGGTPAGGRS